MSYYLLRRIKRCTLYIYTKNELFVVEEVERTQLIEEVCKELELDELIIVIDALITERYVIRALENIFGKCKEIDDSLYYFKDKDIIAFYTGYDSYDIYGENLQLLKVYDKHTK